MNKGNKKITLIERGETMHIAWGLTVSYHYHGDEKIPYKTIRKFSLWRFLSCLEKNIGWHQGSLRMGVQYATAMMIAALYRATSPDPMIGNILISGAIALANNSNKTDTGAGDTTSFDSGSGSDRVLVWGFSNFDSNSSDRQTSACSYNSQALTKVTGSVADNAGSNGRAEIWYKTAPTTGTNNLSVTFAGANDVINSDYFYAVFTGVDQDTPIETSGSHAPTPTTQSRITLTTSVADCVLIDVNNGDSSESNYSVGAGQTELMNLSAATGLASYKAVGAAGSYNMDINTTVSDEFAHGAIALKPATGGATGQPTIKRSGLVPHMPPMRGGFFGAKIS